jgi:hypothetical protein
LAFGGFFFQENKKKMLWAALALILLVQASLAEEDAWLNGTFMVAEVEKNHGDGVLYFVDRQVRVMFAEGIGKPEANSLVSLHGTRVSPSRFLCKSFLQHSKKKLKRGVVERPFTGELAIRVIIADSPSTVNTCTDAGVRRFLMTQQWR